MRSLTYQQSIFKRYHSDKHFSEFYLQYGGKNQLAHSWNDYYVTATLRGEVLVWLSVWSEVQTCTCPADATATHYLLLQ